MADKKINPSCADCGTLTCAYHTGKFPPFCTTDKMTDEERERNIAQYTTLSEEEHRIAIAAAEVEIGFYGKYTRVQEIMEFARRIGTNKIGIATCVALMEESRIFTNILRSNGFEVVCACCKAGSLPKTGLGISPEYISAEGESACNPIRQAELLNDAGTGLNVVIGLCVGHDSLFYRHSAAPVTTLVAKDRVTGNNPAAALYTAHSFYKKKLMGND